MADEVNDNGKLTFLRRFVWSFLIENGSPVELFVRTGPPLRHDGTSTVWQAVLTEKEADDLTDLLRKSGCSVRTFSQKETKDQRELRNKLHEALEGEGNYPTLKCPQCFFYDPNVEGGCNLEVWSNMVTELALTQEKALRDYLTCPLRQEDS
jgi:hypothetical protein